MSKSTKEQQQAWLRESWPQAEADAAELERTFCDSCGTEEKPLFEIGGSAICSAECGVDVIYSEGSDPEETKTQIGILDDLQDMIDGNWPPRKPLEELRAAVEVRIAAWQCDPRPEAYHRLKSYDDVMSVIDRLLAGESLDVKE